jgi:methyl-accepting chemotaxis protein
MQVQHPLISFWRHTTILKRLLYGFAVVLSPLVVGFWLSVSRLNAVEAAMRGHVPAGALEGMDAQFAGVAVCLWVAFGLTAAIGTFLIVLITLSVIGPMSDLREATTAITSGDLTVRVDTAFDDEVGDMARALDGMQHALIDMVREISAAARSVTHASTEMAQGNSDLSQRTEASAARLQETASAIEQIQSVAQQTMHSAQRLAGMTEQTTQTVASTGESILRGANMMEALTTHTRKMSDIIGVIDGIAFQTNILALNAAVEAARAGEQGRGFSVVASEVRSLASRSAASAREIKSLITTTIEDTEAGASTVREAGQAIGAVVESVRQVTLQMSEITAASSEQCTGIASVTTSVSELDSVTQRNAALVEEAAAAAGELRRQAEHLHSAVSRFQVPA